jgi:hypothetical protein
MLDIAKITYRYIYSLIWRIKYRKLIKKLKNETSSPVDDSISCIIFSKDRPMQLYALIESLNFNSIGECKKIVIFSSSNVIYDKAYLNLENNFHGSILFIDEKVFLSFKHCLQSTVELIGGGKIFFLVDDIIVKSEINFDDIKSIDSYKKIISLRMGAHLSHSYVKNCPQKLPEGLIISGEMIEWKWFNSELDWGYPLSVDGHIFNLSEVVLWVNYLKYNSPSSFENSLQPLKFLYANRSAIAYKISKIVNLPVNKVQNEINNYHGSIHQDELLERWGNGFVIDIKKLQGWINLSAHEEVSFEYIKRKN